MLAYIGIGKRNYLKDPVLPFPRDIWEVACILSEKVVLRLRGKEYSNIRNQIFIFPPESPHGWKSSSDCFSERLILHFTQLPKSIMDFIDVNKSPYLRTEVNEEQRNALLSQVYQIQETFVNPSNITMLQCERLSLDIAILFMKNLSIIKNYNNDYYIIERVIAWYKEHIIECPSIIEIANHNSISTSHLRRLFHSNVGKSPKQVFQKIQIERAKS
jgi:hypothetical protein